jgi:hypothetical protein
VCEGGTVFDSFGVICHPAPEVEVSDDDDEAMMMTERGKTVQFCLVADGRSDVAVPLRCARDTYDPVQQNALAT